MSHTVERRDFKSCVGTVAGQDAGNTGQSELIKRPAGRFNKTTGGVNNVKIAIPNLGFRFDPQTGKPVYFLIMPVKTNPMQPSEKIKTAPLATAPANNVVRRLRWLRKRDELERNPHTRFPVTLYV